MTIEYRVSEYLWARYSYSIARRRGELCSRGRYYFLAIWPVMLLGLGTFSALSAVSNGGSPIFLLIGYILGVVALRSLVRLRSYDREVEEAYFPRHLNRDGSKVRLEISSTGISEWHRDVVLTAGVRDIVSTDLDGDILIISLEGLRRIVIPRSSFGFSDLDLESVREAIERLRGSLRRSELKQNNAEVADGNHQTP